MGLGDKVARSAEEFLPLDFDTVGDFNEPTPEDDAHYLAGRLSTARP